MMCLLTSTFLGRSSTPTTAAPTAPGAASPPSDQDEESEKSEDSSRTKKEEAVEEDSVHQLPPTPPVGQGDAQEYNPDKVKPPSLHEVRVHDIFSIPPRDLMGKSFRTKCKACTLNKINLCSHQICVNCEYYIPMSL